MVKQKERMLIMKKVICLAIATIMLLALCACGSSSTSDTATSDASTNTAASTDTDTEADATVYTLKWATTETESTIRFQYLEKPIMDLITEKTNGRIDFDIYYSGSLAGSGAVIKGCQDGICDAGCDNINSYPGVFPYAELMCIPGVELGSTYEEKYANIADYYEAYALEESCNNGVYSLCTAPALDVVLMSAFEVASTDDYKNRTISCNATYADMFNNYGAAITWVVPPEVYESIHLNVIDACINGAGPLSAFSLYEVLDYAYYIPFATVTSSYYLSLSAYNSLPEDLQAILDELQFGDEFLAINQSYVEAMMSDVMTACTEGNANFQFLDLPDDVSAAMLDACADQIAEKVTELNTSGLDGDGAIAILNSYSD